MTETYYHLDRYHRLHCGNPDGLMKAEVPGSISLQAPGDWKDFPVEEEVGV